MKIFIFHGLTLDESDCLSYRYWGNKYIGNALWITNGYCSVMLLDDII